MSLGFWVYAACLAWCVAGSESGSEETLLLPGLERLCRGVNILRGQSVSEQSRDLRHGELFAWKTEGGTEVSVNGDRYVRPSLLSGFVEDHRCKSTQQEKEVAWSASSASLKWQQEGTSTGYDQTSTISVSVPLKGAEIGGETTIRNALVFGNSQTSETSFAQRVRGFDYAHSLHATQFLYAARIDYNQHFRAEHWDTGFKDACQALGSAPSDEELILFFHNYGTHLVKFAQFGRHCTASLFMRDSASLSQMYEFASTSSEAQASLLWFSHSSSSAQASSSEREDASGVKYVTADKECDGGLKTDSLCAGGMKGTGEEDEPSPVYAEYLPLWALSGESLPSLSSGAKARMQALLDRLVAAQVDCGEQHCGGNGVCAPKKLWDSGEAALREAARQGVGAFWESDRCFCKDEAVGARCEAWRDVALAPFAFPQAWANEIGRGFSQLAVQGAEPYCGMERGADDGTDFTLKFAQCAVLEESRQAVTQQFLLLEAAARQWVSNQAFTRRAWQVAWQRECPGSMAVTGATSRFENGVRSFEWLCSSFADVRPRAENCLWVPTPRQHNGAFQKSCPDGTALTGLRMEFGDWALKCCPQAADDTQYWGFWLSGKLPTFYEQTVAMASGDKALSGVRLNDAGWGWTDAFATSVVEASGASISGDYVTVASKPSAGQWRADCGSGRVLVSLQNAQFSTYDMRCRDFSGNGASLGQCYWSDTSEFGYSNRCRKPETVQCANGWVLTGAEHTYISSGTCEGQHFWNFKCCRLMVVKQQGAQAQAQAALREEAVVVADEVPDAVADAHVEDKKEESANSMALPLTVAVACLVACALAVAGWWRFLGARKKSQQQQIYDVGMVRYGASEQRF